METDIKKNTLSGRMEHMASMKSKRFESLDELMEFIGEMLAKTKEI